ncbi:hypothetical protein HG530_011634 [Fusarium avenaceum]|nr:hypothetical protein HG530_011634 [Fusarium avenaceum]
MNANMRTVRIPSTSHHELGQRHIKGVHLLIGEINLLGIFVHLGGGRAARDRDDVSRLEAWHMAADIRFGEVVNALDLTRLGHAISEDFGGEKAQFDLDTDNLCNLYGFVNSGGRDLGEADTTEFSSLDVLLFNDAKGRLEGYLGVTAGALEHIELLPVLELAERRVEGVADVLGRAIRLQAGPEAALDTQNDLVGVLGVLFEVSRQEGHAVNLGSAVELASVPESHVAVDGGAHGLESLLMWDGILTPGEVHQTVASRAYFASDEFRHDRDASDVDFTLWRELTHSDHVTVQGS